MRTAGLPRHLPVALALGAALVAGAAAAAAAPVTKRLALDLDPTYRLRCDSATEDAFALHRCGDTAESLSRRIATHLVPRLQAMGYTVDRVRDAQKAIKSGLYHVAVGLDVHAKPFYVIHEAHRYDKKVVADWSGGVESSGYFKVYGGPGGKLLAHGELEDIDSQVHEAGGGRPVVDDEESVARVYAETFAKVVAESLEPEPEDERGR
jgi:hypothetical protein